MDYKIIVFGFIYFLSGCEKDKSFLSTTNFNLNNSYKTISIINSSNKTASFKLKINNKFPYSLKDIENEIFIYAKKNNLSFIQSACRFVFENTFSCPPLTKENWYHQPELFFNSGGGGLCDDKVSFLAYILKSNGYPVRVINLNGHIVLEVNYQNSWVMLDPELGMFFFDSKNKNLSIQGIIKNNKSIFENSINKKNSYFNLVFYDEKFKTKYLNLFSTQLDNKNETYWHLPNYIFNPEFSLPSKSKLIIQIDRNKKIKGMMVTLDIGSIGILKIPFFVNQVNGKFIYQVFPFGKLNLINVQKIEINPIYIHNVSKKTNLYFSVNPKLSFLREKNKIQISSKSNNLIVKIEDKQKIDDYSNLTSKYYIFNTLYLKHSSYLVENRIHDLKSIKFDNLILEYAKFLKCDSNLSNAQIENYLNKFDSNLSKAIFLMNSKSKKNEIDSIRNSPYIMYCMFITFRMDNIQFLELILGN